MTRFVAAVLALVTLAGCGASVAVNPVAIGENSPQPFELVHADGARVGWVIVGHDAGTVRTDFVMNPGFTAASVSLCASGEAFGWRNPALCERHVAGPLTSTTIDIPLPELAPDCDRAMWFQAAVDVAGGGNAYAGGFKTRIAVVPECGREARGCVKTAKQWLVTPEWPLDGAKLGGVIYDDGVMAELLALDAPNDASVMVAKNVIAARLNVAAGAEPSPAANAALGEAEAWLESYGDAPLPYGMKVTADGLPNLPGWDDGANVAAVLDRFNEGFAGAKRCDR